MYTLVKEIITNGVMEKNSLDRVKFRVLHYYPDSRKFTQSPWANFLI